MSNIFIKSAREQIVYGATIDYKEWHMIDEVVSNYGVPLGVTECVGRIVRCLKGPCPARSGSGNAAFPEKSRSSDSRSAWQGT